jgi:hypothetical protein
VHHRYEKGAPRGAPFLCAAAQRAPLLPPEPPDDPEPPEPPDDPEPPEPPELPLRPELPELPDEPLSESESRSSDEPLLPDDPLRPLLPESPSPCEDDPPELEPPDEPLRPLPDEPEVFWSRSAMFCPPVPCGRPPEPNARHPRTHPPNVPDDFA